MVSKTDTAGVLETPAIQPLQSEELAHAGNGPVALKAPTTLMPLIILSATQFVAILDGMLVNVALPSIQRGLAFSQQDLQWVVNAYLLIFGSFLMAGGRFADVFGSRRLFLGGMGLFAAASLLAGLAVSPLMLITARLLQGLAAAIVSTTGLVLLTQLYPEGRVRDKAFGIFWGAGGVGAVTGLVGGGILTELVGWRWIFTLNFPICLLVAVLGFIYLRVTPDGLENSRPSGKSWARLDIGGVVLITAGLGVMVFALSETANNGWFSLATLGLLALSFLIVGLFIVVESRVKNPMLDFTIFRSRIVLVANLVALLMTMCIASTLFLLALYLQQVLGFSALTAGLALLPFEITTIIVSNQCQGLIGRFGLKRVLCSGMLSLAAGLFLLALTTSTGSSYFFDTLPATLLFGYGLIASLIPLTIGGVSGVKPAQIGLASGLINSTQQIGNSFGLAVLSSLATGLIVVTGQSATAQKQALAQGCQLAFGVAGLIALVGLLVALKFFGRPGTMVSED